MVLPPSEKEVINTRDDRTSGELLFKSLNTRVLSRSNGATIYILSFHESTSEEVQTPKGVVPQAIGDVRKPYRAFLIFQTTPSSTTFVSIKKVGGRM